MTNLVYVSGLADDDGMTDNTSFLAAAAASLGSEGGILFIQPGSYGCNWTVPSNITLFGAGNDSTGATGVGSTTLCGVDGACAQTAVLTMSSNRNSQDLWMRFLKDYAATSFSPSSDRSAITPFSKTTPARTSATRCGALTARQRVWADSISL